jgi:hypothetical protein
MQAPFFQSESEQPHPGRARAIIKAHPEVFNLGLDKPTWVFAVRVSF